LDGVFFNGEVVDVIARGSGVEGMVGVLFDVTSLQTFSMMVETWLREISLSLDDDSGLLKSECRQTFGSKESVFGE